nr:MAG TPA: L SHAPED TAIL FIBER PROTEIN [Caudoviricetes sp.]
MATSNARIQFSTADEETWKSVNPALREGELVIAKKPSGKYRLYVGATGGSKFNDSIVVWDEELADSYTKSAASSAAAAMGSKSAAAASASYAAQSMSAAKTSADAAAQSMNTAKDSASAAAQSMNAAVTAGNLSQTSADNAKTSELNAKSSAEEAAISAGSVSYATQEEVNAGTEEMKIVSPKTLKGFENNKYLLKTGGMLTGDVKTTALIIKNASNMHIAEQGTGEKEDSVVIGADKNGTQFGLINILRSLINKNNQVRLRVKNKNWADVRMIQTDDGKYWGEFAGGNDTELYIPDGDDSTRIPTTAWTRKHVKNEALLKSGGTVTGSIERDYPGTYIQGRDRCLVKTPNNSGGFNAILSCKTKNGSWEIGAEPNKDRLILSYTKDSDYSANRNVTSRFYISEDGHVTFPNGAEFWIE